MPGKYAQHLTALSPNLSSKAYYLFIQILLRAIHIVVNLLVSTVLSK